MGKATSYNRVSVFDIETDGRIFIKLEDIFNKYNDEPHKIEGFYIHSKSKFGDQAVVAFDKLYLADIPHHKTETIRAMLQDPEVIEEINAGKVGFTVRSYMSKTYKRECYDIVFVDLKN